MTDHELIKIIIGKINPIGESNADGERFENLKEMCHLVEMLLMDISDMAYSNKDFHQASIKKCADYADKFLDTTVKDLVSGDGT